MGNDITMEQRYQRYQEQDEKYSEEELTELHGSNSKITLNEFKTLNQMVNHFLLTSNEEGTYDALKLWNELLDEIPLYTNYTFDRETRRVYSINTYFGKSKCSMRTHLLVEHITNKCKIILNKRQTYAVDFFKKQFKIKTI